MAIPSVDIKLKDGGLGIAVDSAEGIPVFVGRVDIDTDFVDASGTAISPEDWIPVDVPTMFATKADIIAHCGVGPLAQAAIICLETSGGSVVVCRSASYEDEEAEEESRVSVNFDIAVERSMGALLATRVPFEMIEVVCDKTSAASVTPTTPVTTPLTYGSSGTAQSVMTKLNAKVAAFWNGHKYSGAMFNIETEEPPSSGLPSVEDIPTGTFGSMSQGFIDGFNPITGGRQRNPLGWYVMARAASVSMGTDLARFRDGPLVGVTDLVHDESAHGGGCDGLGITTARSFPRISGVFLTNARIYAPATSDFQYWQHRRIINEAASAAYNYLLNMLSEAVRVNPKTGRIDGATASAIEAGLATAVQNAVGDYVTEIQVSVDRTNNILSTSELKAGISVIPNGYLKHITCDIGYTNPAVSAQ